MTEAFLERRRSPRVETDGRGRVDRTIVPTVRLLDIGLGGVLMSSAYAFDVGQCARLSARLGEVPVDVDIEVRHTTGARDPSGVFRIGARFLTLDPASRQAMRDFLAAGTR